MSFTAIVTQATRTAHRNSSCNRTWIDLHPLEHSIYEFIIHTDLYTWLTVMMVFHWFFNKTADSMMQFETTNNDDPQWWLTMMTHNDDSQWWMTAGDDDSPRGHPDDARWAVPTPGNMYAWFWPKIRGKLYTFPGAGTSTASWSARSRAARPILGVSNSNAPRQHMLLMMMDVLLKMMDFWWISCSNWRIFPRPGASVHDWPVVWASACDNRQLLPDAFDRYRRLHGLSRM